LPRGRYESFRPLPCRLRAMPANLTPQYHAAEEQFREAKSQEDKLAALRQMLAVIPKHKGTEKLQADIKRRISRFQDETSKSQRRGRRPPAWVVESEGAGQVAVVGLPNCGKSQLVDALTGASPVVGDYPFTTQLPQPAMCHFEDVQVQLVDSPPLHPGHTDHWFADVLRHADAWMAVLDLSDSDPVGRLRECEAELLRILTPKSAEGPRPFRWDLKRTLFVGCKADVPGASNRAGDLQRTLPEGCRLRVVSAVTGDGMDRLPEELFRALEVVRVYSKAPGKKPDLTRPYVLPTGSTVMDVASAVHRDIAGALRYAKLWGSGRYDGQAVQKDFVLSDGDVVELHA
jgi:ribosome-interacting GTPase 1